MLDKKLKRKWVAALRGGTWTQIIRNYRCGDTGRCALGVLSETISPGVDPHIALGTHELDSISYDQWCRIVEMNDHQNRTFPEIADWIEENL